MVVVGSVDVSEYGELSATFLRGDPAHGAEDVITLRVPTGDDWHTELDLFPGEARELIALLQRALPAQDRKTTVGRVAVADVFQETVTDAYEAHVSKLEDEAKRQIRELVLDVIAEVAFSAEMASPEPHQRHTLYQLQSAVDRLRRTQREEH